MILVVLLRKQAAVTAVLLLLGFPQITAIGGSRDTGTAPGTHDKGLAIDVAIPGWDTATGKQLGNQINSFCKLTLLNLVLGTPFGMQCLIPLVVKADHIRIRDQTITISP